MLVRIDHYHGSGGEEHLSTSYLEARDTDEALSRVPRITMTHEITARKATTKEALNLKTSI